MVAASFALRVGAVLCVDARGRRPGSIVRGPVVACAARRVASTFRVDGTRPTKLRAEPASDYRFEEQGGVRLPKIENPLDGFSTEPAFGSSGGLGRPGGL